MSFYWVNLGSTHNEVKDNQFLWAPHDEQRRLKHWDVVGQVKEGDIIFCAYGSYVHHVAIAEADAYKAKRPVTRKNQEKGGYGYQVNIVFEQNAHPVLKSQLAPDFLSRFNESSSTKVFTNKGVAQFYMSHLSTEAGLFLLEAVGLAGGSIDTLVEEGPQQAPAVTEREALVLARIGQGLFRQQLLARWNDSCALTGLKNKALLVASHIVPWADATNAERLTVDNGLPLVVHMDCLFDRGHISFADDGELLLNDSLGEDERKVFNFARYKKINGLTEGNRYFLSQHRKRFGFEA